MVARKALGVILAGAAVGADLRLMANFSLLQILCIETVSMSILRSCTAYLPSDVHVPAAVEGGGVASEHDAGHAHPEVAQTTRTWRCRKIIVNAEK